MALVAWVWLVLAVVLLVFGAWPCEDPYVKDKSILPPDLLYLEDIDGDGVADKREVVLTGFFTNSSSEQLRVASPTLGPDGWIYLTSGLAGGKVSSPKHPPKCPNKNPK